MSKVTNRNHLINYKNVIMQMINNQEELNNDLKKNQLIKQFLPYSMKNENQLEDLGDLVTLSLFTIDNDEDVIIDLNKFKRQCKLKGNEYTTTNYNKMKKLYESDKTWNNVPAIRYFVNYCRSNKTLSITSFVHQLVHNHMIDAYKKVLGTVNL